MSIDATSQFNTAGKLLVCTISKTGDPFNDVFHRSVYLMLESNENGAVGVDLAHAFEGTALLGGPNKSAITLLYRDKDAGDAVPNTDFASFISSIYNKQDPRVKTNKQDPDKAILGFADWDAAQLQAEIRAGIWHVIDPTEKLLFETTSVSLYEACAAVAGIDPAP